ncbi:MAG: TlpA family protein disulfide reductase [Gammaproteobacteria bacterium]|nr:TlpA family protein disulfide reductase [Gammaproteobacteria bacterium]
MSDRRVLAWALVVASLSAVAGYQVSVNRHHSAATNALVTDVAPQPLRTVADVPVRIKDLNGREHSLTEWRGKVLVVNFWATWCPPCVHEIPGFIELQKEFGPRGLQFVGIALDDVNAASKFAAVRGINYPVLAGDDNVAELMRGLGNTIGALPFTVVFDPRGEIVTTHQGEWSSSAAREVFESLVKAPAAQQQVAR